MLAFLPTIPGAPRDDVPSGPSPRDGGTTGAVLVSLIAFCALLAPVGWAAWPRGSVAGTPGGRPAGPNVGPTTSATTTSATLASTPPSPHGDCAAKPVPLPPDSPCAVTAPK